MNNSIVAEEILVKNLRGGDTIAFERLFNNYGDRLFRFAMGYLSNRSDAEEVVQDVFFKVWSNRKAIKSDQSFKSYVFTIAFNTIRTAFVRMNTEEKYKQQIAKDVYFQPDEDANRIDYFQVMAFVDKMIDQLPQKRKEIFTLSKKEGLDNHEIAQYLNISEKTVRNQLSTALAELKEQVKKQGMAEFLYLILFLR